MENISFKQWIVAGVLSGVVIGILILILLFSISFGVPFGHLLFIWDVFYSSIFLGLIIGIILFFVYDKLPCKKRSSKCLLASIVTMILMVVFSFSFYYFYFSNVWKGSLIAWLIPFIPIGHILMGMIYIFDLFGLIVYPLLIGAAFGLLINYFITKMERKHRNEIPSRNSL